MVSGNFIQCLLLTNQIHTTIKYMNYKRAVSSEAALLQCKVSLPLASHVVRAFFIFGEDD